ncbi:MAG: glycine betaine ABC transporter substrate-binding protein [Synechococcus sp.]|uniref:glycine betaine ABC transporter substrate-binding protein n=1 Tax=Synechococcus sp. BMK-MC-1 TaxID=1442551 RepID=UPI00164815F5|nr:glycine betaine ABC transporter substrate-binding protein [Synechococcus sp. BMK-MC-1]QNI66585.1 ABC-type glycine betaine/proline transporter/ substrate binding component [Synechococcus sp. BMK-MC-1]
MSDHNRLRRRAVLLGGLGLAGASMASLVNLSQPPTPKSQGRNSETDRSPQPTSASIGSPLRLGWSPWADAEVISLIAQKVIQQAYNIEVERVLADIGIQYASLARGDLDMMLMAWLPLTHRDYWRRVRERVIDFGSMYAGRLGWVVPDYVPEAELSSIQQLQNPALAARFNNRVQGIDPGSGLNQASAEALKSYQLNDLNLVASSSAAMTAVLDQAIRREQWVIVTSWMPHWMFARYKLRFLDDPKRVFGGIEWIHALGRPSLDVEAPDVAAFLTRFHLPDQEMSDLLLKANERSAERAVDDYLETHPARVRYWTTGQIASG